MTSPPIIARRTCRCVNDYCAHHQALRAHLAPIVAAGRATCWRCTERIAPGQPWDLGHDDDDRTIYRGIECRPCNRATSGRRKQRERRWIL
jgi:hypothetical protein